MSEQFFTRRLSFQLKLVFLFVILPLYLFFGEIIVAVFLNFFKTVVSKSFLQGYTFVALLNLVFDLVMVILVCCLFRKELREQWLDFRSNWKQYVISAIAIGIPLLYVLAICGNIITKSFGSYGESYNQIAIVELVRYHPILMLFTTVVLAPVLEEVIFRGFLFGWAYELGPVAAYLISSFVFGFIHVSTAILGGQVSEIIQIFPYMLMGLGFCFLYEKSNTIYVPILTHVIHNGIAMCLLLFFS